MVLGGESFPLTGLDKTLLLPARRRQQTSYMQFWSPVDCLVMDCRITPLIFIDFQR